MIDSNNVKRFMINSNNVKRNNDRKVVITYITSNN